MGSKNRQLFVLILNEYRRIFFFFCGAGALSFFISSHFISYRGEETEMDEVRTEIWEAMLPAAEESWFLGLLALLLSACLKQPRGLTA